MKKVLMLFVAVATLIGCSKDQGQPEPEKKVTSIEFTESLIEIMEGGTEKIEVKHSPSDLAAPIYEWSSSDDAVVSVIDGKATAKKVGEAKITVVAKDLNLEASMTVKVLPIVPQSLTLTVEKDEIKVGEKLNIKYAIAPSNTTDIEKREIEWSTSDSQIATIDNGELTGLGAGEVEVTAKIKGTDVSSKLKITITPVLVEEIELNSSRLKIVIGDSFKLTAIVKPENVKDKSVTFESLDPSVATVDDQGNIVAKSKGNVSIVVTSKSNPLISVISIVNVVDIDEAVSTYKASSSLAIINGYTTGNISAVIANFSTKKVKFISFEVKTESGQVVLSNYDTQYIEPNRQITSSGRLNNAYNPKIYYVFEVDGRRFERIIEI